MTQSSALSAVLTREHSEIDSAIELFADELRHGTIRAELLRRTLEALRRHVKYAPKVFELDGDDIPSSSSTQYRPTRRRSSSRPSSSVPAQRCHAKTRNRTPYPCACRRACSNTPARVSNRTLTTTTHTGKVIATQMLRSPAASSPTAVR